MQITAPITKPLYKKALTAVYLQLLGVMLIAIAWFFYQGAYAFLAALLGGVAWIIPNLYFLRKIFKVNQPRNLQAVTKDFFIGEAVKLFISAVLIVLFLKLFTVDLLPFLTGYVGVVVMSFFSLAVLL